MYMTSVGFWKFVNRHKLISCHFEDFVSNTKRDIYGVVKIRIEYIIIFVPT